LDWLTNPAHEWRPQTRKTYLTKAKVFFDWLGRKSISSQTVEEFITYLFSTGKKAKTVKAYLDTLKMLDRRLWKFSDLFANTDKIRARSTPARFFTEQQARRVLAELRKDSPPVAMAALLLLYCFIYPNELRLLRVRDINLETWFITIDKSFSKSRKTQQVSVPVVLREELIGFIKDKPADAYIFGTNTTPQKAHGIATQHQAFIKKYGFDTEQYKFTSWIHTGARLAARTGINTKEIQLQMRRYSLDKTSKYLDTLDSNPNNPFKFLEL
jgi:integrase